MLHQWDMLSPSVTEEYDHAGPSKCYPNETVAWNKGKLTGAKPLQRPKHVWSIWKTFQIEAAFAT